MKEEEEGRGKKGKEAGEEKGGKIVEGEERRKSH